MSPPEVSTSQLRFAQAAWPRVGLNQERVQLFASILDELPPIEVVPAGDGTFLIADGVHRWMAARSLNRGQIEAVILSVQPGESPVACAFRRALETATRSALPLTTSERRAAAKRLVQERPEMSHREIARVVGVSHDSIDRWAKGVADSATQTSGEALRQIPPSPDEVARRLVRSLSRLDDSRGLLDLLAPARMGTHLARAFDDIFGNDSLRQAERFEQWVAGAVKVLRREP
jgi:ParB-like nuclease domain